jgi:NAD(P)-dependent dehydrogenase (short-subunit alcohol dehydrogenase family)
MGLRWDGTLALEFMRRRAEKGELVFGVSRFKDRITVIAGAEHPLGAALARCLAGFGALVIAVGRDDAALRDLARDRPDRIEPLALRPGRRDVLSILREAWGGQPIDLYMDFMALCGAQRDRGDYGFAQSAGVAAALVEGMRAGPGLCAMSVPDPGANAGAEDLARAAGFEALVQKFAGEVAPGRILGMRLPVSPFDWTEHRLFSAGDAALVLCHPVSRGFANGSVMRWNGDDGMGKEQDHGNTG